jgi:hypothetical protein
MKLEIDIPDEAVSRLGKTPDEVIRGLLELAAAEGLRSFVLTRRDVRIILGLKTPMEVGDFMAVRRIPIE